MIPEKSGYIEEARVRIRSVKYKDGRGELRLLPSKRRGHHDTVISHLRESVEIVADDYRDRIAGYALVAFTASNDARFTTFFTAPDNPLWLSDVPDYVANALRVKIMHHELFNAQ